MKLLASILVLAAALLAAGLAQPATGLLRAPVTQEYVTGNFVPKTRTINGHALDANFSLSLNDVTGGAIDGTPIGSTTPSTGAFTNLAASTSVVTPRVEVSGSGQGLQLYSAGGPVYVQAATDINYILNGNTQWRMQSTGNLIPWNDNTVNFGSGSRRIKDIFVSNAITATYGNFDAITMNGDISMSGNDLYGGFIQAGDGIRSYGNIQIGNATVIDASGNGTLTSLNSTPIGNTTPTTAAFTTLNVAASGTGDGNLLSFRGAVALRMGDGGSTVTANAAMQATVFKAVSSTGALELGNPADVKLIRDSAGALALRNGSNAQTFRIGPASNFFSIYDNAAGGGTIQASGTNQSITLSPSGSGYISATGNGFLGPAFTSTTDLRLNSTNAGSAIFLNATSGKVVIGTGTVGSTSPMLKRNGADVEVKLSDDSKFTSLKAGAFKLSGGATSFNGLYDSYGGQTIDQSGTITLGADSSGIKAFDSFTVIDNGGSIYLNDDSDGITDLVGNVLLTPFGTHILGENGLGLQDQFNRTVVTKYGEIYVRNGIKRLSDDADIIDDDGNIWLGAGTSFLTTGGGFIANSSGTIRLNLSGEGLQNADGTIVIRPSGAIVLTDEGIRTLSDDVLFNANGTMTFSTYGEGIRNMYSEQVINQEGTVYLADNSSGLCAYNGDEIINVSGQLMRMFLGTGVQNSSTVVLSFGAAGNIYPMQTIHCNGSRTITASGYRAGVHMWLRITDDGDPYALTWPSGWKWLGDGKPETAYGDGATPIMVEVFSWGTTAAEVIAITHGVPQQ